MYNLIYNPIAGNGRSEKCLKTVMRIFDAKDIPCIVHQTNAPGHATKIAKSLVDKGVKIIVAVGGDGTLAEVATAMYGTKTALGIIPAGTGNDYRRAIGVPDDITEAVDFLLEGKPCACDALECNGEIYLNIVSLGFDVDVVRRAEHYKIFGEVAYTLAAIEGAFFAKNHFATITIDGKEIRKNILLTAIGCGTHYGGGINAMPKADITDGLLDVCVVDATTKINILKVLPKYMGGIHESLDIVSMYTAKEVSIVLDDEALPINADGELLAPSASLNVKILSGLINVIR